MKRNWLLAVGAAAIIYEYLRPRNSTVEVVNAIMGSYSSVIKAAIGGIENRHPDSVTMVKAMPEDVRESVLSGLHEADRMWIEAMLMGTVNES